MSDVWTPHVSNPNMPPISSGEKACESWQPGSAAAVSRSTTRDAAAPPASSCFKRGASSAPVIGFRSFRFAGPNPGLGLAVCAAAPDRCHGGCARAGSIEMREIRRNGRPRWLGLALLLGAALVLWPGANARADDSALAALKESDDRPWPPPLHTSIATRCSADSSRWKTQGPCGATRRCGAARRCGGNTAVWGSSAVWGDTAVGQLGRLGRHGDLGRYDPDAR